MTRRWMLSIVLGSVAWAGAGAAAGAPDKQADFRAAMKQARDGDMQADWNKMLDARERFVGLTREGELAPLAHYYIGYTDWRLSSLAFVALGPQTQGELVERAVTELDTAVGLKQDFPDAHALLATCLATLINIDRSRLESLAPRLKAAWQGALPGLGKNPRVTLLRAIAVTFAPPEYGGNYEKGIDLWKLAIAAFEEDRPAPLMPDWGHAEALAWLGGTYLRRHEAKDAATLLERAVALRPDFWWASKAALPIARRPLETK